MSSSLDAQCVLAFRAGDKRAGEQLVDRYYAKILGFCRSKAPAAANDIAQRCFLACFEGLAKLQDPSAFRSYLFAIACNLIRKHYRNGKAEGERLDFGTVSSVDLDPTPSRILAGRAEQRLILEGLRRIPLDYQMVLELFYWEDMRAADIAEVLDIPLGTAKTRIRRGRELLEQAISSLEGQGTLLESTMSDLEGWARKVREELGESPSTED